MNRIRFSVFTSSVSNDVGHKGIDYTNQVRYTRYFDISLFSSPSILCNIIIAVILLTTETFLMMTRRNQPTLRIPFVVCAVAVAGLAALLRTPSNMLFFV